MHDDLAAAPVQAWSRLSPAERDRLFPGFISAALRLDKPMLRRWIRRRLRAPPLIPLDLSGLDRLTDADVLALIKQERKAR